ncbi:hypothetical protein BDR26DRAFT_667299 [Obelidium mucronatum]|nr:hypothetical protein BDR26DRAFT_667299 [Obelidium mucronatum]
MLAVLEHDRALRTAHLQSLSCLLLDANTQLVQVGEGDAVATAAALLALAPVDGLAGRQTQRRLHFRLALFALLRVFFGDGSAPLAACLKRFVDASDFAAAAHAPPPLARSAAARWFRLLRDFQIHAAIEELESGAPADAVARAVFTEDIFEHAPHLRAGIDENAYLAFVMEQQRIIKNLENLPNEQHSYTAFHHQICSFLKTMAMEDLFEWKSESK